MGTRRHHKRRYRGGKPITQEEVTRAVTQLLRDNPKLSLSAAEKIVHDKFVADRLKGPAFDDNEPKPRGKPSAATIARMRARVEASKSPYERTPLKSAAPPPAPPPPPPPAEKPAPSDECSRTLAAEGITGTSDEKKKAYRKFALREHPDKGGDTAKFQKVTGCYEKLSGAGRKTRRRKSRRRR